MLRHQNKQKVARQGTACVVTQRSRDHRHYSLRRSKKWHTLKRSLGNCVRDTVTVERH